MLLPDSAQKYLSKIFDDEWMRSNGFLDEDDPFRRTDGDLVRKPDRALGRGLEHRDEGSVDGVA